MQVAHTLHAIMQNRDVPKAEYPIQKGTNNANKMNNTSNEWSLYQMNALKSINMHVLRNLNLSRVTLNEDTN